MENSPVRVKHEPPVEFVLIIPRPAIKWHTPKQEGDVKPKLVPAVTLTKFDAKWPSDSALFQTFLTCKHCQLVVKRQSNLTNHLRTCRILNPNRFDCDFCGEIFRKKWLIRRHMTEHSNEKLFCCTECGVGLKSKDKLTAHKKIHNNSIACSSCQKTFAKNQSLKLHQMQHRHGIYATAPEEIFGCGKCDKSFSNPKYLKKHQRNVHDENEVKCKICDKICKNRTYLLRHSQTHTKVECSICNKMVNKYWMSFHVRSHGSHFECDLCAYSNNRKDCLKIHIERKHLLMKLFKDSKCREDFSDFELLEELQLKYPSSATSAEKEFKCDKCDKSFDTPKSLNQHKRKVHPQNLFDCQRCKKAFKTKSHLNRHTASVHAKKSVK